MLNLAIITPSYIHSSERMEFSRRSLASLQQATQNRWLHIVVDDLPRWKGGFNAALPDLRYALAAAQIYQGKRVKLLRGYGRSNVPAMLRAISAAKRSKQDLLFIHLDDNVYIPLLQDLFIHAIDAFERNPDLMEIRVTGYPILSRACTPELGNLTQLYIEGDRITFDRVCLQPTRYENYTLWWSEYQADMVEGNYWPIALWSTIYRTEFLERLLTFDSVAAMKRLGDVEKFYKNSKNWRKALSILSGKLGYINMQFGGLEMHRNKNWQDLVQLPNQPVH